MPIPNPYNVAKPRPPKTTVRVWPWILAGMGALALGFGGLGGWGATAPLASAVIATGKVTVDTNRKQVQHLEGGIVAEILVRDGDSVSPGAVLMRLDGTRARASLGIVSAAYHEELAKEARYTAERDEKDAIQWPEALRGPAHADLRASHEAIFVARRETFRGEVQILGERISQLGDEIVGLTAERDATERQLRMIKTELKPLESLFKRGNTTRQRLSALQREAARLDGERGELIAEIAVANKAIGETKLEILQKRKAFRSDVVSTLRDVQSKIVDLRERYVAAQDVLKRLDIRAPVAGKIVGLSVHSRDEVIQAGETLLEIVPSADRLLVEVRVQPQDIDNVGIGQTSEVRMLAFQQRTTPTLTGEVSYVSADALTNPQNDLTYYLARIHVPEAELQRLDGQALQPGMPAEVMIRTGERTALAYMLQPFMDSMNRAWRED